MEWGAEPQTPASFLLSLENTAKFPSQGRRPILEDHSTHMYGPLPRRISSLMICLLSLGSLPASGDEELNAQKTLGTGLGAAVSAQVRHEADLRVQNLGFSFSKVSNQQPGAHIGATDVLFEASSMFLIFFFLMNYQHLKIRRFHIQFQISGFF